MSKAEAAMIYAACELPKDPILLAITTQHPGVAEHPRVLQVAFEVFEPVLEAGQRAGQIRTDVSLAELSAYLTAQMYLAMQSKECSVANIRRRFHLFVAPGIVARDDFLPATSEKIN